MAFQKILVALDHSSPESEIVFQEAIKIAKRERSHLILFHCVSWENQEKINPLVGIGALGNVNLYETLQKCCKNTWTKEIEQVDRWLKTYWDRAKSQGISVEYQYQVGNPSASICEQAHHWGADLIVIGRQNRMKWSEFLWGSISGSVLNRACCSVFVVQLGRSDIKKLSISKAQPIYN